MHAAGLPTSLTLHFNPKGILPGQGARTLSISLEGTSVSFARLGTSDINGLPLVPVKRWRPGGGSEATRQAVAAIEAALPRLLPALEATPSDENDVDNGYGWAKGNSFALLTGPAGYQGTEYFYGSLAGDARASVQEGVTLLRQLASAMRA
jgi:hypothetical protein